MPTALAVPRGVVPYHGGGGSPQQREKTGHRMSSTLFKASAGASAAMSMPTALHCAVSVCTFALTVL